MTRLSGAKRRAIPGYVGGVQESTEPVFGEPNGLVALRRGVNAWHENQQVQRRGGTREAAAYDMNGVTEALAILPYSQTGALVISHAAETPGHRVHAHAPDGGYALPTAESGTEVDSTAPLDTEWETETPGVPNGDELFEAVYVADDSPYADRRPLQKISLSGGSLVVDTPEIELGAGPAAPLYPAFAFTFASVLFIGGYGDEASGNEPHLMRHSFLGRDPGASDGFDPDAYATIGAQGQPLKAGAKGQGIALVAKESELYRITGSGDALPGWQFGIQQMDASLGIGCVNARCLVFAEGHWYGLSRNGPWRCDGANTEVLRSNRDQSWRAMTDLSTAFVAFHPRRRAVLFGLSEASSSLSGEGATVLWTWDLRSDRWAPDQRPPQRIHHAAAIAPSGVVAITAPSAVQQVLELGAFRETSLQLRWVNGITNEPTEIWLSSAASGSTLVGTVGAGINGAVLTGLTAGVAYSVTLRHIGAIVTPFSGALTVYTRPRAPRLVLNQTLSEFVSTYVYDLTNDVAGRTGRVATTNASAGAIDETLTNLLAGVTTRPMSPRPFGPFNVGTQTFSPLEVAAWVEVPDWPESVRESVGVLAYATHYRGFGWPSMAPKPAQLFDGDAFAENSITVMISTSHGATGQPCYVFAWKTGAPETAVLVDQRVATAPWYLVTIPGLESGESYEIQCTVVTASGQLADITTCYTAVPVPTATIATAGVGTPVTNITVTPPDGKAGYDIHIASASAAFDALYTGVASTETTYQSEEGACGRADRYVVRARRPSWPEGLEWSPAVVLDIVNPCVIGS